MSEIPPESALSAASPARAADLDAIERRMRTSGGTDLTEAKEAIVDALLSLALNRCTGSGRDGEVIYGMRPSSRFVSGFLLPRFDETGLEDETSDIRIATMGSTSSSRPKARAILSFVRKLRSMCASCPPGMRSSTRAMR